MPNSRNVLSDSSEQVINPQAVSCRPGNDPRTRVPVPTSGLLRVNRCANDWSRAKGGRLCRSSNLVKAVIRERQQCGLADHGHAAHGGVAEHRRPNLSLVQEERYGSGPSCGPRATLTLNSSGPTPVHQPSKHRPALRTCTREFLAG
jgi:hypothetical protein